MMQAILHIGEIDRTRCRQAFEERFTAERMTKEYLNVYERLIHETTGSKYSLSSE